MALRSVADQDWKTGGCLTNVATPGLFWPTGLKSAFSTCPISHRGQIFLFWHGGNPLWG